ncbi:MAG: tetratricopeptide repeat protein [Gammaproteobacteria bacterium]|nr:tetratricopeptide repeat protein [Gammaproteobacteria bacterium]
MKDQATLFKSLLGSLCALTLAALLQTCATTPDSNPPVSEINPNATALEPMASTAVEQIPIEYGSFTREQLYSAIISELGAQRGEVGEAGEAYFDLALETQDLGIIRRAIQFASVNNDVNALLQLGLLWTEVQPGTLQPHLMLNYQFLQTGNLNQALSHMARIIELGGEIDFSALAARTGQLNSAARADLIENLQQLTREFAEQTSIRIALTQLLAQNGEYVSALDELEILLRQVDSTPNLILLQAQILQRMQDMQSARQVLARGLKSYPQDRELRMSYARLLIQAEALADARIQYGIILEQDPEDWDTLFSLGLLSLEIDDPDSAEIHFKRLAQVEQRADEANYYLGYTYDQLDRSQEAINHYRQVRIGTDNFLPAQQQATRLSIAKGELDSAHTHLSRLSRGQPRLEILFNTIESGVLIQNGYPVEASALLNRALNKYPNETELLFARVLLTDSLGDRDASEQDLRLIIRMKPDDARALNHLGYMLADQTTRFDEALELLQRAIAISPDDPAIIDSLGWVQYKLGRYQEALANLQRAFAVFPDHEVASHVGEVLWMMGRQEEATRVWLDALDARPDSELISEVLERFQPDL